MAGNSGLNRYTSSDDFCASCHIHPQSTTTWKQSVHHDTRSGVVVHCVECHLPPGGVPYVSSKISTGLRDVYGKWFKDAEKINWEQKSRREYAAKHVYKASCLYCHTNLFPRTLTKKGDDAHIYYEQKKEELRCINCHLDAGHYHEKPPEMLLGKKSEIKVFFSAPTKVDSFVNFREKIPGSTVDFAMVAIPGGTFTIGSSPDNEFSNSDEHPQRTVEISPFWMGKYEVSWDEYQVYYQQNAVAGRSEDQLKQGIDAVTGPTPAYGNPGQGWGRGDRPAITMTFHAAQHYCQWLSRITGKKYRLPTEAEWEYACRGGTPNEDYFFNGSAGDYSRNRFMNRLFGVDTTVINSYVIYAENSRGKTSLETMVKSNPFGLAHMLGNVKEFCLDWYLPDIYASYPDNIKDPRGPLTGTEHVIRGGSYNDDAADVRISKRDYTRHDAWMVTDPQIPKSLWWFSDNNEVGFRVVCEYSEE
jgi:sulfatase modifying factor 1